MAKKRKAEEGSDSFVAPDDEVNDSQSDTSSLFVPNVKRGCPKKVHHVPVESKQPSAAKPKVYQQEDYVKDMEDLEMQMNMHKRIAICIMVSKAPVKIIVGGSNCSSRAFYVYADLLRGLSDWFQRYDSGMKILGRNSNGSLAATRATTPPSEEVKPANSMFGQLSLMKDLINERKNSKISGEARTPAPSFAEETIPEACPSTRESETPKEVLLLHTIRPEQFACFLSWAMTGEISEDQISETVHSLNLPNTKIPTLVELWYIGAKIRSPGFSNRIIQCILTSERLKEFRWPSIEEVRYIDHRARGSRPNMKRPLHELAVLAVAIIKPLQRFAPDPAKVNKWRDLLMEEQSSVVEASLKLTSKAKWTQRRKNARRMWDDDVLVEMWFLRERKLDKVFDKWVQG